MNKPSEFSEQLQREPAPKSPETLDRDILNFAREQTPVAVKMPWRPPVWMSAMATCSVVGVAVLLVVRAPQESLSVNSPIRMEIPQSMPAKSMVLEEIVVTARKKNEPFQRKGVGASSAAAYRELELDLMAASDDADEMSPEADSAADSAIDSAAERQAMDSEDVSNISRRRIALADKLALIEGELVSESKFAEAATALAAAPATEASAAKQSGDVPGGVSGEIDAAKNLAKSTQRSAPVLSPKQSSQFSLEEITVTAQKRPEQSQQQSAIQDAVARAEPSTTDSNAAELNKEQFISRSKPNPGLGGMALTSSLAAGSVNAESENTESKNAEIGNERSKDKERADEGLQGVLFSDADNGMSDTEIKEALKELKELIDAGKKAKAEQGYEELLEECQACGLPETLDEALAELKTLE